MAPRRPLWSAPSRAIVFAALAAALLLGLGMDWVTPAPPAGGSRGSDLYRRAGDTFVRIFYLAGDPEVGIPSGRELLTRAAGYYLRSLRSDRSNIEAAVSLGLVLDALRRHQEAAFYVGNAARQPQPAAQQEAVQATLLLLLSRPPKPEHAARAQPLLSRLTPGPLTAARAYAAMGRPELSGQEWSAAAEQAGRIVPDLIAVLIICGLMMMAGAVGVVAAFIVLLRARRRDREEPPPPSWGFREPAEALVLWVFLSTAVAGGLSGAGMSPRGGLLGAFALVLPTVIGGCGAIAWMSLVTPRGARFGWKEARVPRDLAIGLAAAGAAAPAALALQGLLERLLPGAPSLQHPLIPLFATTHHWGTRLALGAAACLVVPMLEEALFRGALFRALRRHWAFWPAAAASGLIFALGHMGWAGLLPYALLGMMLAWLLERTGSLLAPTAAHGAFNAFNLALLGVLYGS